MRSDVGAFLRLTSAIDATLSRVGDKGFAAKPLRDAYMAFRTEASALAKAEDVLAEFDRLFPSVAERAPAKLGRPVAVPA